MTDSTLSELARLLGRRGAAKGGKARMRKLSAKQRSELARKAALARWNRIARAR